MHECTCREGNRNQSALFIVVCTLTLLAAGIPTAAAHPAIAYIEGEAIVTFKTGVDLPTAQAALDRHSAPMAKHFAELSKLRHRHMGLVRAKNRTTAALLAELQKDPTVEVAEPNYLRWVTDTVPNDSLFPLLWALQNTSQSVNGAVGTSGDDIKFIPAWGLAMPSTNPVVVATIDTGIDFTHPDLVSNLWTNPGEIPGNGLDDDGNGYVDDYYGYDFADGVSSPYDSGYHGTHVAGTIAASGNNQIGVIGVDYKAKVMALKASSDGSTLTDAAIIEALQYATMMKSRGVNIVAINASFGGGGSNSTEQAAIQAAGDAGIVFCAAAGNSSANNDTTPTYPASYRLANMIVVAATGQNDALASFSNYGAATVDLGAPGVNILSAEPLALLTSTASVQQGTTTYAANGLTYAGATGGITASLVDCGLGYPSNFTASVRGNIALISRGTLFFSDKVANAMSAGAAAAIIYNNVSGSFSGTLQYASNWIPAVSISQADGQTLLALLPAKATVINNYGASQPYQLLNGTSMATPHVVGAVAFAAMNFPAETVSQRIQRVLTNVDIVPALQGLVRTGGRLNLRRIVDTDANGLPDWWEQASFGHLTGTDPNADPDHDGLSNLQEFYADTSPTDSNSCLRLTVIQVATNGVQLKWQGGIQSRQIVMRRAALDGTNAWVDVQTNQPPTATNGTWLDAAGTNQTELYRIRAERP